MSTFINQACLFGFCTLLLVVAISDVRIRRIPNLYVLGILLLYPLFVLTSPIAVSWTSGLLCFGLVLAVGFVFSTLGYCGPGDAKLMAATSLWAGTPFIFPFLMITALCGGVLAAFLWLTKRAQARLRNGGTVSDAQLKITGLSSSAFAAFLWFTKRAKARFSEDGAIADAHLGAEAAVSLSNISVADRYSAPASVFVGTSTPEIGSTGGEDGSTTTKKHPAMELPYGAAIALGGLAIAAMLLMRG